MSSDHVIQMPNEAFIAATGARADQLATAYIGNDHMMTGFGDGFRAGAWWAHQQLTTNSTLRGDDQ